MSQSPDASMSQSIKIKLKKSKVAALTEKETTNKKPKERRTWLGLIE